MKTARKNKLDEKEKIRQVMYRFFVVTKLYTH